MAANLFSDGAALHQIAGGGASCVKQLSLCIVRALGEARNSFDPPAVTLPHHRPNSVS